MVPAKRTKNPTLEEVQKQFAVWRNERTHRSPVPEALWEAAVALTKQYSRNAVSRHLGLNYRELKVRTMRDHVSSPFIELATMSSLQCTIEMERPSGEYMRITGTCNAEAVVRAFFGE